MDVVFAEDYNVRQCFGKSSGMPFHKEMVPLSILRPAAFVHYKTYACPHVNQQSTQSCASATNDVIFRVIQAIEPKFNADASSCETEPAVQVAGISKPPLETSLWSRRDELEYLAYPYRYLGSVLL